VRFRDITITEAPPGADLRHAITPLLGEATNPIDAAIAGAVAWLGPERGREPSTTADLPITSGTNATGGHGLTSLGPWS
jgi:hypothetical protein